MAASRTRTTPSARDFTGRQRDAQAKAHEKELAERAGQISLMNAVEAEQRENEVIDVTAGPNKQVVLAAADVENRTETLVDEVEEVGVSLANDFVVVRIAEDIEDMTFGVGNNYSFKGGSKYRITRALYEHLEEKGLVWH